VTHRTHALAKAPCSCGFAGSVDPTSNKANEVPNRRARREGGGTPSKALPLRASPTLTGSQCRRARRSDLLAVLTTCVDTGSTRFKRAARSCKNTDSPLTLTITHVRSNRMSLERGFPRPRSLSSATAATLFRKVVNLPQPISPELALVDPELARVARALLPPPPDCCATRPNVDLADVLDVRDEHGSRATVRVPISKIVVAMTFVAAVIGPSLFTEVWQPASQRPTLALAEPQSPPHEVPLRGSTADPRSGVASAKKTATSTVAIVSSSTKAAAPSTRPVASATGSVASATSTAPQYVSSTVETVLRWAPTSKASYYNVVVWYGGKRVLDVWPQRPHVKLPHVWNYRGKAYRFEPGRYLWFVYPYLGRRGQGRFVGLTEHGVLLSKSASDRKQGG
jgi:hypothetical protein